MKFTENRLQVDRYRATTISEPSKWAEPRAWVSSSRRILGEFQGQLLEWNNRTDGTRKSCKLRLIVYGRWLNCRKHQRDHKLLVSRLWRGASQAVSLVPGISLRAAISSRNDQIIQRDWLMGPLMEDGDLAVRLWVTRGARIYVPPVWSSRRSGDFEWQEWIGFFHGR